MSTNMLSKTTITTLINTITRSTEKLQDAGLPVHFFMEDVKGCHIIAMAALLNTNIAVYSKYNNILKWSVITPSHRINSHPSEEDFIYIKHVNENHYEPVLSI